MRIKEVHIGRAVTINLGNYESARVEVGMTADINEDDDLDEAVKELKEAVLHELRRETKKVLSSDGR